MHQLKKISVVSGCYNEEGCIEEFYHRVRAQLESYSGKYTYELIIVDNCSADNTVQKLRELAHKDKNLKVIVNSRNFGHIRSPFYGIINATGDAVIYLASDLQDPPELISDFVVKWEAGFKAVLGVRDKTEENLLISSIRKSFYCLIEKISDDNTQMIRNFTGFGLYDKKIIDIFKSVQDPYPYLRGLVSEVGFEKAIVYFSQPLRKKGRSKNNFYTMYDNAILGIIKHSRVPLRMMTFVGFCASVLSFVFGLLYLAYKLVFWDNFEMGMAPVVIGLFFFASVQLFSMGVLGEYIGAIYTRIDKKPLVIEKERINF